MSLESYWAEREDELEQLTYGAGVQTYVTRAGPTRLISYVDVIGMNFVQRELFISTLRNYQRGACVEHAFERARVIVQYRISHRGRARDMAQVVEEHMLADKAMSLMEFPDLQSRS